MIDIVIKDHGITAAGHAGSAEAGHDLVCCAVSILMFAAAKTVKEMQEHGWLEKADVDFPSEGYAFISYKPAKGCKRKATIMMHSIVAGLEMLAEKYPDNVRLVNAMTIKVY